LSTVTSTDRYGKLFKDKTDQAMLMKLGACINHATVTGLHVEGTKEGAKPRETEFERSRRPRSVSG
jgi:hypothetical protein